MPAETFPGIEIRHRGAHYAVLDAGAHVLAWTPVDENPVLWVSPLAVFAPGTAVRGGIPVVFPWFGAGPAGDRRPSHGFARTAIWRRTAVTNDLATSGRLEVRHSLDASGLDASGLDASGLASEPFEAELVSEFTAGQLAVSLVVRNPGPGTFRYEEALHTYLAVSDVGAVSLDGLSGCAYLDKVAGAAATQDGPVRFTGETDRIYRHTADVVVDDPDWARRIVVEKRGSANTVVWNPGREKGTALTDVGSNWPGFVCVEAGNVGDDAIELAPGEEHILTQTVRLS